MPKYVPSGGQAALLASEKAEGHLTWTDLGPVPGAVQQCCAEVERVAALSAADATRQPQHMAHPRDGPAGSPDLPLPPRPSRLVPPSNSDAPRSLSALHPRTIPLPASPTLRHCLGHPVSINSAHIHL